PVALCLANVQESLHGRHAAYESEARRRLTSKGGEAPAAVIRSPRPRSRGDRSTQAAAKAACFLSGAATAGNEYSLRGVVEDRLLLLEREPNGRIESVLHEQQVVDLAVADVRAPDHVIRAELLDGELEEVAERRLVGQEHLDQERRVLVVDVVHLGEREM